MNMPLSAPEKTMVIRVGTLIDGSGEPPAYDAGIQIEGSKIVRVGPWSEGGWPLGEQVSHLNVPAAIPGLIDIHVHIMDESCLPAFLDYGVTSVRDVGTAPDLPLLAARKAVEQQVLSGPRIFSWGAIIDGPRSMLPELTVSVKSKREARAEVNRQADAGVDGIKVYWKLPRPILKTCVAQAKERGLPVSGHIGMLVGTADGARIGIDSIEHLVSLMRDFFPMPAHFIIPVMMRLGMMDNPAKGMKQLFKIWSNLKTDDKKTNKIIEGLLQTGAAFHPTVVTFERILATADPVVRADHRIAANLANPILKTLHQVLLPQEWTAEVYERSRPGLEKMMSFVNTLYEAGVHLGAGTDVSAPYVFPGESLHQEMEIFVQAGIPPVKAIQMATMNNAITLRREDIGRIAPGLVADLVLLDQNPAENISATRQIKAVFKSGQACKRERKPTREREHKE